MAVGFGAVTFAVLIATPGGSDTAEYTEIHIPGGAVNYLDIGGALPNRLELSLYFDDTGYNALRALIGTQATLTYPDGTTYANALLASLQRVTRLSSTYTIANATFITP